MCLAADVVYELGQELPFRGREEVRAEDFTYAEFRESDAAEAARLDQ